MIWGTGNLTEEKIRWHPYGMIIVTYPSNSSIKISGGKASKNKLSQTQCLYYVKEAGIYTLTATSNTSQSTVTQNVTISSFGQGASVQLSY